MLVWSNLGISFLLDLQVYSFVRSTFPENLTSGTPLDSSLKPITTLNGSISVMYNQIHLMCPETLNFIRSLGEGSGGGNKR